jgi:hypothetical protein
MLPSERIITQQYREKNFTVYSSLIQTLKHAEKNRELTVWNSNQRPLGTAPLPEVHANVKKNGPNGNMQTRNSSGKGNARELKSNVTTSKREKAFLSKKIVATKLSAIGVVVTITLLRNVGLLSILSIYT